MSKTGIYLKGVQKSPRSVKEIDCLNMLILAVFEEHLIQSGLDADVFPSDLLCPVSENLAVMQYFLEGLVSKGLLVPGDDQNKDVFGETNFIQSCNFKFVKWKINVESGADIKDLLFQLYESETLCALWIIASALSVLDYILFNLDAEGIRYKSISVEDCLLRLTRFTTKFSRDRLIFFAWCSIKNFKQWAEDKDTFKPEYAVSTVLKFMETMILSYKKEPKSFNFNDFTSPFAWLYTTLKIESATQIVMYEAKMEKAVLLLKDTSGSKQESILQQQVQLSQNNKTAVL